MVIQVLNPKLEITLRVLVTFATILTAKRGRTKVVAQKRRTSKSYENQLKELINH